ncbi:MAG: GNAT family N-acetyltransferase [Bacteroidaceae bacterium]|nr:GNAT family N-acetyltransferase [Bacteroidaceae bacterium]
MIKATRYTAQMADKWDEFVSKARNSTLLHRRGYMDYHADRFQDASLVFTDEQDNIVALLPACLSRDDNKTIVSHQGLTYGGFIVEPLTHTFVIEQVFDAAIAYYRTQMQATSLVIKHIPYIYSSQASDEELYFIHSHGGQLIERGLSQTIDLSRPLPLNYLRRRCLNKAQHDNLKVIVANQREEWDRYHPLLSSCVERHGFKPVHNADELWLLHSRFPDEILLYGTYKDHQLLAGAVVYLSPNVAHAQYLAVSDVGKKCGALDLAIMTAITDQRISHCRYFDFGISTERDGSLNHGLTLQKEGFGARGVCYDIYKMTL